MSFILDALRKSEHARERRAQPSLVDLKIARPTPSRLPWILAAVGILLAVNIGLLVWAVGRAPHATQPAASVAAVPALAPASAAASAVASGPAAISASAAPPAAPAEHATRIAAAPVRPLAEETEQGADPELEPAPPLRSKSSVAHAPVARGPTAHVTIAGLPSIHELPPQATAGLPPLHIDLHVYSTDAAQRFVIINGQRLHEGGKLTDGPTVELITPEGAIVNHQGTRFLLPRE